MGKRVSCLFLTMVLLFTAVLCAHAEDVQAYRLAGLDETEYRTWSGHPFFEGMEKLTGIRVEAQQFTTAAAWQAQKEAYLQGGDLPDALFKAQLSTAECMTMVDAGVIVDLKPYLETCMPNFSAMCEKNPAILDAITLPGGQIAALPYINELPTQNVMWVNNAFLSRLNLKAPTSREEFVQVLRAFKEKDANGNGNPNDEIPMAFLGPFDLKFLAHAFGLVANDYNIFADESGTVRFMPLESEFPDFIRWCRELYAEGLLDRNGFATADTMRTVTTDTNPQIYGVLLAPMITTILPASWIGDYQVLMPLAYEDRQIYRDFGSGIIRGTFAVTSACRDVPGLLAWADALYTEEGSILASVGTKNVDYLVDGDGTWRLTESASQNSYHTVAATITSSAAIPGFSAQAFQSRFQDSKITSIIDQLEAFQAFCVLPFPYVNLTKEESESILSLQEKLGMLVDMRIAQWVLGEEEITDESFAQFRQDLNEAGLEAFLSFWQKIYDAQGGKN